jgi:hypothetical protein
LETGDGKLATLHFITTDAIPCTDGTAAERITETSFLAESILFSVGRQPVHEYGVRSIEIRTFDGCTGQTGVVDGYLAHDRGSFAMSADARSAVVDADLPLFIGGEVAMDVTFTASSSPVTAIEQDRTVGTNTTSMFRTKMKMRDATVTGSILLDGRNLLAGAHDVEATIGTETLVSRTVTTTG